MEALTSTFQMSKVSTDVYRRSSSNSLKVNEGEEVALSLPPQKWFLDFRVRLQRQPTVWFVTRPQTRKYGKPKWIDIEIKSCSKSSGVLSTEVVFAVLWNIWVWTSKTIQSLQCFQSSVLDSIQEMMWGWNCKELCAPAMGRRPSAQDLHELMKQKIESLKFI